MSRRDAAGTLNIDARRADSVTQRYKNGIYKCRRVMTSRYCERFRWRDEFLLCLEHGRKKRWREITFYFCRPTCGSIFVNWRTFRNQKRNIAGEIFDLITSNAQMLERSLAKKLQNRTRKWRNTDHAKALHVEILKKWDMWADKTNKTIWTCAIIITVSVKFLSSC